MNEQTRAMCFMAGANSIFYGCKLLTTPNPEEDKDLQLFRKLGINRSRRRCWKATMSSSSVWSRPYSPRTLRNITTRRRYELAAANRSGAGRAAGGGFRRRLPVTHGAGRWLERKRWLNFSSNDYLGLSQHPAIIAARQQGATRYGVGAGGSGHVSGYSEAHRALEEALADWLGYPRALLFISGFAANQR